MEGENSIVLTFKPGPGPPAAGIQKIKPAFEIPKATSSLDRPTRPKPTPTSPRVTLSMIMKNSLRVRVCLTHVMSTVKTRTTRKLIQ